MDRTGLIPWGIGIGIPAAAGFVGVLVGAWLASRRDKQQRRYAFLERQLRDFCSPLLGIRTEIQIRSELRVRISAAASAEWQKLCSKAREKEAWQDALVELDKARSDEFTRVIDYNNRQLAEDLIPAYRRMLTLFREQLWLCEPETRQYLGKLVEFVDTWERWLSKSIPREVIGALGHQEGSLEPFYRHIEDLHASLRRKLTSGSA